MAIAKALTTHLQTELAMNTHVIASDIHHGLANTQTVVSDIHRNILKSQTINFGR